MLTYVQYTTATTAAQSLMRSFGQDIIVDGKWGKFTDSTFNKLNSAQKTVVQDVVRAVAGVEPEALREFREGIRLQTETKAKVAEKAVGTWLTRTKVIEYAAEASRTFNLDNQLLLDFVEIEAASKIVDGERRYNALSISPNGRYRGLYQMGAEAWRDAQSVSKRFGVQLPDYASWDDPRWNTLAAAAYIVNNRDVLRRKGYIGPFNVSVAYAAHNQGVGGFLKTLRDRKIAYPGQSQKAIGLIKQAAADNGVTLLG